MTSSLKFIAACSMSLFAMVSAQAGECPADKVGVDVMKPGATAPVGVTDTVLSAIDISKIVPGADGRMLRLRRLVIQPGGIVPWHSHAERPANIYVVEGGITEYRSTCSVPIEHKAGEATGESVGLSHWWKNNTTKPTVLLSSDILPPEKMKSGADQHM